MLVKRIEMSGRRHRLGSNHATQGFLALDIRIFELKPVALLGDTIMKRIILPAVLLLSFAATPWAMGQYRPPPSRDPAPGFRGPNVAGQWFMDGNPDLPTSIYQRGGDNRAEFINENGDRKQGYIDGNRIRVPGWGNLEGRFEGDTIYWSNGTVWAR